MKKSLFFAVLWGVLSLKAFSGTMGPSTTYTLDGLYVGLGTGFTSLFTDDKFITRRTNMSKGITDTNRFTYTSILFNGNIGYGKMFRDVYYLGAKASIFYTPLEAQNDISYSSPAGSIVTFGGNTYSTQVRPFYNIDAVIGYEVLPHLIPFVEGGVTFANVNNHYLLKRTRSNLATASSVSYRYAVNLDDYSTGYNVGLGVNYQVRSHWLLSSELLYNFLGSNFGVNSAPIPGTSIIESQSRRASSSAVNLFASVAYLI